ncbi:MAG: hypothetical protein JWP25_8959 [Bradyrhizobium sp.]|nr:hypothetical protein [Bradyrhizobium sp.]
MRLFPFDPAKVAGLQALITIQKALTVIRFTTAERAVSMGGFLFPPAPGADTTGLQYPSDGSTPSNADVVVMVEPGGIVSPGDGVRGVLDNWPITIEWFDLNNAAFGTLVTLDGTIGSVDEDTRGMATIAANGQLRLALQKPLTERFTLTGREDLGDDRCKIPLLAEQNIGAYDIGRNQQFVRPDIDTGLLLVSDAFARVRKGTAGTVEDYANLYLECSTLGTTDPTTAPDYSGISVGDIVTDGTAAFTVKNAWTRAARGHALDPYTIVIDSMVEPRAILPSSDALTWFLLGGVFIRSGPLNGFPKIPIRTWDGVSTIGLALPVSVSDVPADTQMEIHAGCNLTREQCFSRFNNIVNLRAETFVPPPDLKLSVF